MEWRLGEGKQQAWQALPRPMVRQQVQQWQALMDLDCMVCLEMARGQHSGNAPAQAGVCKEAAARGRIQQARTQNPQRAKNAYYGSSMRIWNPAPGSIRTASAAGAR